MGDQTSGTGIGIDNGPFVVVATNMAISGREIASWETWMRAAGHPETTIGLRRYHISRVMREIQVSPWELDTEQLVEYLASKGWKPNTRRSYRSSLRMFYRWAQATGRRQDDPAALIPTVKLARAIPTPTPEDVYRQGLLDATTRVRLMIQLAAICGLRRSEISRCRREDVQPDLVGHSLHVVGKGGHERDVPLPDDLAREILAMPAGWLFPSPRRPGPLTPAHVGKLVSAALATGWSCHKLRHRCGTIAYWGSKDIRAVQELLGHAKLDTTMVYTKVRRADVRALIDLTAA